MCSGLAFESILLVFKKRKGANIQISNLRFQRVACGTNVAFGVSVQIHAVQPGCKQKQLLTTTVTNPLL